MVRFADYITRTGRASDSDGAVFESGGVVPSPSRLLTLERVVMKSLKDAILSAQTDLQNANRVKRLQLSLDLPIRLVGRIKSLLELSPEDPSIAITMAKRLCEVLSDCAQNADRVNSTPLAEDLRRIVRSLSPVVARSWSPVYEV